MAEGKKTGGRQKGTPNKKTNAIQDRLEELGCDPIEGMVRIGVQAEGAGEYALAGTMYKELAQYIAPKRKAVEISADSEDGEVEAIGIVYAVKKAVGDVKVTNARTKP